MSEKVLAAAASGGTKIYHVLKLRQSAIVLRLLHASGRLALGALFDNEGKETCVILRIVEDRFGRQSITTTTP